MATFSKQFSCFFLIMLSTCCQTQARESKFFSKYLHLSTKNYVTIPSTNPKVVPLVPFSSPSPSPAPITSQIGGVPASAPVGVSSGFAPAPAPTTLGAGYGPAPAPSENEVPYYGLYAKNTKDEEEEFSGENAEELTDRESSTYTNSYSNNLSNNNGFWTSNHKGYHNTNNGYDFDGGYKSEPQGMSDTRLLDNGRYYHDVEHENYTPSGYNNDNNEEGYYYGNYKKSKYEFDSMEEYEKQEGFADVQQEFIP